MSSMRDLYLKNSLIPKRYLDDCVLRPSKTDLETFNDLNLIKDNIVEFINGGSNLLICSNKVGNGKTTWATKLAKSYIDKISDSFICNGSPVIFISITNFLNEKKLAINNDEVKKRVQETENKILKAKLVIFDDLCVKDVSQYDLGNLYYWIDYRTSNKKSCIYTSNLTPDKLISALDSRLYSRIVNYSTVKKILDGDHRRSSYDSSVTSA